MLSHFSCVWLFATLWTVDPRLFCPWDSPGKITGVGCHSLLQGNLPNPGIETGSPALQVDSLPLSHWGSPLQFSCSVVSDSLRPHESQRARPPCPSPTPWVHSDSCPLSQWCHPAVSSSVVPFSSCPQSLPASETFPMNQLFTWGGESTGASALASFLPKKSQGWSSGCTGWISLQSKGLSRVFSNTTVQKHHRRSAFFIVQLSHPYMTTGENIALTRWTFVGKVMSLLLNMLSRLVITFLPRSKHLLISWLQSASAVILEPPKIKSDTVSTSTYYCNNHISLIHFYVSYLQIFVQVLFPYFLTC